MVRGSCGGQRTALSAASDSLRAPARTVHLSTAFCRKGFVVIQPQQFHPTAGVVRAASALHGHHAAALQRAAPLEEPVWRHGAHHGHFLQAIDAVHLMNPLGQINANSAHQTSVNLVHGTSPFRWTCRLIDSHHQSWRIDAVARGWEVPLNSVKRSSNGRPPGPGLRHGVHFLSPSPGVLPSAPT